MADLFSGLLRQSKNYAAHRVGLKLVEQEMASLDNNLGQESLRYIDKYNLRSLG